MKIEFVNLYKQYESIKDEIDHVISDVIKNSYFVRGPYVDEFEKNFSKLVERKYCISCGNGTDSLYIAMKSLGVKPGDEVIAPAHSWISTTETITQAGGKVIFCDTDKDTFTIDVNKIEEKITQKTVGIIPVHLYGQACNMTEIMNIARKYNMWVLEDCAQSHLAKHNGQHVGTFGDVASYSFYPGKNLGAMGDAGAIVTNNENLAIKMTMFARHGGLKKGDHTIEGVNSRLDGIQGAILNVKQKYLKEWTFKRQEKANYYIENLSTIPNISTPKIEAANEHVWHLFVIKAERRDELAEYLKKNGISTVINYPIALPFLPAYSYLGHHHNDFPNAYENQSKILSLPIYPELENSEIDFVCAKIKEFYSC